MSREEAVALLGACREALEPFAALVPLPADGDHFVRHYAVEVGNIRRARAAMSKCDQALSLSPSEPKQ